MNLFELAAVLTLNKKDYDKGISDAEKKAEALGARIGNGLKTIGRVTTAAVGAAATAVGAIVKQSVQAYGEYEQLVGGAQLMFGDAYKTVAENAKNAYKTVQLSSSEYLTSIAGLNISTRSLANCARFIRRISSSVLPENILPQTTSMLPLRRRGPCLSLSEYMVDMIIDYRLQR